MGNTELFAQCPAKTRPKFRNIQSCIKLLSVIAALAITVFVQSCVAEHTETVEQADKKNFQSSGWRLDARQPYLEERIIVRFKAGNTRRGLLKENDSDQFIAIEGGSDTGVYDLNEVLQVDLSGSDPKRIYP